MNSTPAVERDAESLRRAFQRVHEESFADDPLSNPELQVEVLPVGEIPGQFVPQTVHVLITPWGINGVVVPGRDLPESMVVSTSRRPLLAVEQPETGPYVQVTLVSDVSRYTSQQQARTIAESMVPVLLAGLGIAE